MIIIILKNNNLNIVQKHIFVQKNIILNIIIVVVVTNLHNIFWDYSI